MLCVVGGWAALRQVLCAAPGSLSSALITTLSLQISLFFLFFMFFILFPEALFRYHFGTMVKASVFIGVVVALVSLQVAAAASWQSNTV